MGEMIKEMLKKLKPKEKLAIIVSMSALAVVLLGVVLLLAFCGGDRHKHTYDCYLEKIDGSFNFVGKCNKLGCKDPTFVVSGVAPAVESTTEPSCGVAGEIVYSYTHKGNVGKYVEQIPSTGKHYLNGSPITDLLNEDGSIDDTVEGVRIITEGAYVCNSVVDGFYMCESCEIGVRIPVYRYHEGVVKTIVYPNCDTAGKEQLKCKYCDFALADATDVEPFGHYYVYELQKNGSKYNLIGTCQRSECPEPSRVIANVSNFNEIDRIEASCAAPAEVVYQYVDKSGEVIKFSVYGEKLNHTLCGVDATTLANEDGTYNPDQEGVKMFADKTVPCLNNPNDPNEPKTVDAYYICEECGGTIAVDLLKPKHDFQFDYSTVENPTAVSSGKILFKCNNKNCVYALPIDLPAIVIGTNAEIITGATADSDAIVRYTYVVPDFLMTVELEIPFSDEHDHVYTYTLDKSGDKTSLIGKCTVVGCQTPDYIDEGITELKKVSQIPADCLNGKIVGYTCKLSTGESLAFEVIEGAPTSDHILNGEIAEGTVMVHVEENGVEVSVKAFVYGHEGIKVFSGHQIKAGTTVQGYFECENCNQIVRVWVFIPEDYQP